MEWNGGRGRAARNDLYSKYEPWENSGTYEGWLRLEQGGVVYRIERRFRKDDRYLRIINETQGREEEPTDAPDGPDPGEASMKRRIITPSASAS